MALPSILEENRVTIHHSRILPLKRGHNFRDMGGYSTRSGRVTRWRTLYRSGYMSHVDESDSALLQSLGIATICDFRANGERERRPTRWHEDHPTELWSRNYEFSAGALDQVIERADLTASQMQESMIALYRELPFEQAPSYAATFARIAAGNVPLVFNCSAGKDRTGLAAALLLTLVGVDEATVQADYLLTNDTIDGLINYMRNEPRYATMLEERPEAAQPLLRAEAEYLETSFAAIKAQTGSVEHYFQTVLGLGPDAQADIRHHLLD
jgi:protein-tyrosine phosphatase